MAPESERAKETGCSTYPEHDCFSWQRQHYCSNRLALYSQCGTCGLITGFQWRGIWPRIRSLFTSDPLRTTYYEA
jgi:hypothetical protein